MAYTFKSAREKKDFAEKLSRIKYNNSVYSEVKDENQSYGHFLGEAINHLKKIIAENEQNKIGPATKLLADMQMYSNLNNSLAIMNTDPIQRNIDKAADDVVLRIEKLSASDTGFKKSLTDFLEAYGYVSCDNKYIKFASGISNCIDRFADELNMAKRKTEMLKFQDDMREINADEKNQTSKIDELINMGRKVGVDINEISDELSAQTKICEDLKLNRDTLKNKDHQKKLRSEAAQKIKKCEDEVKKYQDALSQNEKRFAALDEFNSQMDLISIDIKNAEQKIDGATYSLSLINMEIQEKDSVIQTAKNRVDEYNSLKLLKEKLEKDHGPVIQQYTDTLNRIDKLQKAFDTMQGLSNKQTDINSLLSKSNGGKKLDGLENDEINDLANYLEAKDTIIKLYHGDGKGDDLVGFFKGFEKDNTIPPQIAFMGSYGGKLSAQISLLAHQNGLIFDANKDVIEQYGTVLDKLIEDADCEVMLNAYKEDRAQLEKDRLKINSEIDRNTKIAEGFYKKATDVLGYTAWKTPTFEKIKAEVKNEMLKVKDVYDTTRDNPNYKKSLDALEEARKEKDELSGEKIAEKLKNAETELKNADDRLSVLGILNRRKDALIDNKQKIEAKKQLMQEQYKYLEKGNGFDKIKDRLTTIKGEILYKSKDPKNPSMSKDFKPMYDKLGEVINGIDNPDISVEDKKTLVNSLKTLTENYIKAKNKQIRPAWFASEQRHVRLNSAHEIYDFADTAIDLINSMDKPELKLQDLMKYKPATEKADALKEFNKDIQKNHRKLEKENKLENMVSKENLPVLGQNQKEVLSMKW